MKLLRIITILRIKKDTSLINNIFNNKFNFCNFPYIFILLKFFIEINLAIITYFLAKNIISSIDIYYIFNSQIILLIMILILFFHAVLSGVSSYHRTHIFPFEQLRINSYYSERKTYLVLIVSELLYSISNYMSLPFTIIILLVNYSQNLNIYNKIVLFFFILINYIGIYVISNRIAGIYRYKLIVKKIGFTRFLIYFFISIFLFIIGNGLFKIFLKPLWGILNENIISKYFLINDQILIVVIEEIKLLFLYTFNRFIDYLTLFINIISENYIQLFIIIMIISIFFIFILPINLINTDEKENLSIYEFKDICYIYTESLIKISFFLFRSTLLIKDLKLLKKKKWLVSKSFFSNIFLSYESIIFIGIFIVVIANSSNIIRLHFLLVMNLLIMGNQSFEIRESWYPLFVLETDSSRLDFILMSKNGFELIFKYKLVLLILIFSNCICILIFLNIFIILYFKMPTIYIFLLIILDLVGCIIFPLIQLYMLPLVTKFDFSTENELGESSDEQIIIEKLQSIPRYFLIVIPIFITPFIVFIDNLSHHILYIEYIYLVFSYITIFIITKKILRKGLNKLYERS